MYELCFWFLMFYFYSIFGWIVECIYCSIRDHKITYNRGFLMGPYCPIYGIGALYMYFFLNRYYHDPIVLFVMAVVGTSLLEYFTSFWMEKLFKARWWDYSNESFNLEGRICLKNAIMFGLLGLLFIYLINPLFMSFVRMIPHWLLIIMGIVLAILFFIDNIIIFIIMNQLKKSLTNLKKDSTEDLDKQIKQILSHNNFFVAKIFKSFPKVKLKLPRGEKILLSIKKTLFNMENTRVERRKKVKEIKKEISD